MDEIQKQHERAVGDVFVAAFNETHGTEYVFYRREDEAPDLLYRYRDSVLRLEIRSCYYDNDDAKANWQIARNLPNAPNGWLGVDFDEALVTNINAALQDKCAKDYGPNCVLVIYVSPRITTFKTFEALIPSIEIPPNHRFAGIYLVGYFGVNHESTVSHAILELRRDSK